MPDTVAHFRRRPCRAWLIEWLDDEWAYARRIGVGQDGLIDLLGPFDDVMAGLDDPVKRSGLPIIVAPPRFSSTGAA